MNFEQPKIINEDIKKELDKIHNAICFVSEQARDNRLKLNAIEEKVAQIEDNQIENLPTIQKNTAEVSELVKNLQICLIVYVVYLILASICHHLF